MNGMLVKSKANFGTAPVFLTAISTILGAVMFLRFGYAVGNIGFVGTLGVILLGHLVTIPTALAVAEIATNQKVEGGGEYFIISRSFGILIGAAIGSALYLSQAISVAFYVIAFGEAFGPVFEWVHDRFGVLLADRRLVSLPAMALLTLLVVTRGADLGVKALYLVVGALFFSLILFFLGGSTNGHSPDALLSWGGAAGAAPFFTVFAICFPAFTGMTAGVGLSGDLRDPKKSIPLGTVSATLVGMAAYVLVSWKLAVSADPETLVSDQLVMSRIALWAPIIPIGLACATLSSALGSIMVAPRTLQALGGDGVLPTPGISRMFAQGRGETNEPVRATLLTAAIAFVFVAIGDVDFVAKIISMIFMVTYGSICLISFLEHFAADPSYRPVFRSRWYVSLLGALTCLWLMFEMSALYAALSLGLMLATYIGISRLNPERMGLSAIFQGAIFQISRRLQVFLQQSRKVDEGASWRPSVVCLSSSSFDRLGGFDLLRWISHRYGFGSYIHYIEGYLSRKTNEEAQSTLARLVRLADVSEGNVYVDTLVTPSFTNAISQLIQLPGISGKENNMILLEYPKHGPTGLEEIVENYQLIVSTGFDVCILGSSDRGFGYRREIHIWLAPGDYENANLMILLAYIILGHPDWRHGVMKIFALTPAAEIGEQAQHLVTLIRSGRLPIAAKNVELIPQEPETDRRALICEKSMEADLTIMGFQGKALKHERERVFEGFDALGNVLFVNTTKEIEIVSETEVETEAASPDAVAAQEELKSRQSEEAGERAEPRVEKEKEKEKAAGSGVK